MKRSPFAGPDAFSLSPLLALLPACVGSKSLELIDRHQLRTGASSSAFAAAYYARYERVRADLQRLDRTVEPDVQKSLDAEEKMLKELLDWLEMQPTEEGLA